MEDKKKPPKPAPKKGVKKTLKGGKKVGDAKLMVTIV